jgi:starch synthase (maltosyl-transferring)
MSSTSDRQPFPQPPAAARARVVIDAVRPAVDQGAFPTKSVVGEPVRVAATLLIDGHDLIDGVLRFRHGRTGLFIETSLQAQGNDVFTASFTPDAEGLWEFAVEAWVDAWGSHCWALDRKARAGQDVELDLLGLAALLEGAAGRAGEASAREALLAAKGALTAPTPQAARVAHALDPALGVLARRWADKADQAALARPREVWVDPLRARFSSWYELFPRSCGPDGRHGTLRDVEARLPYLAELGFDTLYLPPIHPIGRTHRKGPNNTLTAGPNDVGSPWAIGGPEGGHKAVHPDLGTLEDFKHLLAEAKKHHIEVALDIAFQASPDHPYVREHADWFVRRADGSIQYAENPPKKYQDVYPFDFTCADWRNLWAELASVFFFWAELGVRTFRVDNPHTKPLPFWRWCLSEVKERYPDAIFLAEAFTRPHLLQGLAKAGFSQSYTYFTWRTTKHELTHYLTELTQGEVAEYLRPNLWPNTPDILPEHLQLGTRGTFIARLVLAATLSSSYGIYGPPFELLERRAREGAEEYVDNEKYQLRQWNLDHPESLRHVIAAVNRLRREEPALARNSGLTFHATDNEKLLAYSKAHGDSCVLVVVNLDPYHPQAGLLNLTLDALGLEEGQTYQVHDVLSGSGFLWSGAQNYVELDPARMPAHVFKLKKRAHTEQSFEYFL